jgi:hypothetical protein
MRPNKLIRIDEEREAMMNGMSFNEIKLHNKKVAQSKIKKIRDLMTNEISELMGVDNVISEWCAIAEAAKPLDDILRNMV